MPTPKKELVIEKVREKVEKSQSAVLVDYRGMSVAMQEELRRSLRAESAELKVVKNTLLKRATDEVGFSFIPSDAFAGQTAVVFGYGDAVTAPKAAVAAAKKYEQLVIKSGFTHDMFLSEAQVRQLSSIPGRQQLYGMVVSTLVAPLRNTVSVLQGNIRNLVYALNAVREKKAA